MSKIEYFRSGGKTVVVLSLLAATGYSQLKTEKKEIGSLSIPDLSSIRRDLKKDVPEVSTKLVPMDSPVDPAEYVVGPGDMIGVNIWSSSPVELTLRVTPEATLLIPDIGLIDVRDMTLEHVKTKVSEKGSETYINADISVTLISPRQVRVQIEGNVLYEQQYEMYSTQRVDNLIEVANQPPDGFSVPEDYESDVAVVRQTASSRHILLRRRTGKTRNVDLVKYAVTREGRFNPYLHEGDIVYVPWKNEMGGEIGIYGATTRPGGYEYVPGDSLVDLLRMGYGFSSNADSAQIRFSRLSADEESMETILLDGPALLRGNLPNIALRPGDRVVIPESPDPRENYRVRIEGEVVQEGQYPITKQKTNRSAGIDAAGGFREGANIAGSVLFRSAFLPAQAKKQGDKEKLFGLRSSTMPGDSLYYLTETELRQEGEIVSVDFHRLFVEGDSTQDVFLRPYDRIVVPRSKGTVYVFGQIVSPGHIPYEKGKDYSYYVAKAGGFAEDARTGDVRIVKGVTRAWLLPDETTILDGDYIWVPREVYHPLSYYITPYAQLASILAVVLTAVLVVNTINK